MSNNKPIRFVAVGDNHGDMVDDESFQAVQQFIKDYKPTVRVHLGDCFDLRSLRRGVGNDAESAESLKQDIQGGIDFLNMFKPTVYLWGNHEARLDNLIANSGSALVRDYCEDVKTAINSAAASLKPNSITYRTLPIGLRSDIRTLSIGSDHQ